MAKAGGPSLVVACLAAADLRPEVDPLSGAVSADVRRADLSASDQAALEHALRAGEAWGARVLTVAAGPAGIDPVLRIGLSLGALAVRVPWPGAESHVIGASELAGAPHALAQALSAAILEFGQPDLVVCGDRSPMGGTGSVPGFLGHELGLAQALGLVSLRFSATGPVEAERRLDAGWRERLQVPLPAICSVEAAGIRLRRASLGPALATADAAVPVAAAMAIQHGDRSPVPVRYGAVQPYRPRTHVVPAPAGSTRERLLALTGALVNREPPRLVGPVGGESGADELLDYLGRHGYLPRRH